MKRIKLLVFLCGLTFAVSCGQQKRYVSYKVKEGETISDIAERLSMQEDDLLRLNPDVSATPKANTIIVIPNQKITKSSGNTNSETTSENSEVVENTENPTSSNTSEEDDNKTYKTVIVDYKTHTVQPGETVYRLTKTYDISKEELLNLNPEFPDLRFNKLSVGQVLKVDKTEKEISLNKEDILKQFVTHEVKSKETIFSLTRFYNITKEDLIKLNPEYPGIVNNELQIGQLIKIRPLNTNEEPSEESNAAIYEDIIDIDKPLNIALLLPFRASEYDSISSKDIFKKNRLANMVTDFYMGAAIAIDSIKEQGIDVNVNVYDTGKKGANLQNIVNNNDLDDMGAIIGPFYSDVAITLSKEVNAPIIFPHYSSKQKSFSSSKLVKSTPDKEAYISFLTEYLKDNFNGETIFVVDDGTSKSKGYASKISSSLKRHDSIQKVVSITPKDGYIKKERFTDLMKPDSKSWVILTSDNNVAVANALNSMIGLPEGATARVFSIEKNKAFDKIDNYKLANINFTYVTNTYSDNEESFVRNFNKKYLERNNALPSDYSVRGFDITYDVLIRLASGKDLKDTFKEGVSFRLENKFDYRKKLFGTYNNQGLYIVKFNPDLSLERLK
ncbi:hypothetical protein WH52_08975 [Tenacibaculum holothuriorum]|uniref:LysM domain-containing protein n=1 Tax=Tenacibaculum holothuriorum TaxID=1635173 RepID=A0A1Y2PD86_9FLAO|nr:LysM peptidoglycan-binding domain-containing protein [Tenacibaculum holothuriorum]OSY88140.1 hypothetical protein WH52_08975 [Tenacibaculum holothuriorum]